MVKKYIPMGNVVAKIGGGLKSVSQMQFSLMSAGSQQIITHTQTSNGPGQTSVVRHMYQGPTRAAKVEDTSSYSAIPEGDDSGEGNLDKPYWKFDPERGTFIPTPQYSIITAPGMAPQKICEFCGKEGPSEYQKWGFKWICNYCRKCLESWPTWTEDDIVGRLKDTPTRIKAFYFTNKRRKLANSRVRSKISKDYTHGKTRKVVNRIARYKPILRKCRMKQLGVDVDVNV